MSTTVTIGYGDGSPLEPNAEVDLLVGGMVVATASPDGSGKLTFAVDPPANSKLAVRFHASRTDVLAVGRDEGNAIHLFYRDAKQHISDLHLTSPHDWILQDLNDLVKHTSLAKGNPVSVTLLNGDMHVFYRDTNDHICDFINKPDGSWSHQDVSARVRAAPRPNGDPTVVWFADAQIHVFYRDTNNHISDIWTPGEGDWAYQDLNDKARPASLAKGTPASVSFINPKGSRSELHVFYRDIHDHLSHIYFNGSWNYSDMHGSITNQYLPKGDPTVVWFEAETKINVYFRDMSDSISFFCGLDDSWVGARLAGGLGLTSDPAALAGRNQIHVFYRDKKDHISDAWRGAGAPSNMVWAFQDLNDLVPDALLAKGKPVSIGFINVYYRDINDTVFETVYDGKWQGGVIGT